MANPNQENTTMICPVCGKEFSNIHTFAEHLSQHSREEKRRKEEEEKQRKADQKKVDAAKLETLKKGYLDAYREYLNAKNKFEDAYGRDETNYNYTIDDFTDLVNDLNLGWGRWL